MKLREPALKALKDLFGERLLLAEEDILPYGADASSLFFKPEVVVFPETKAEVSELLRLAESFNFPVVARGSGTSTTGSSLPVEGGMVVSFAKMNRILEIVPEERLARVEPGVLNGDLKNYLKKFGLFYPPDPASYAFSTIGGNVATGAGGPRGLKYGTTKDYVLSLEVALSGGKLLKTGPTTLKGVVPYNLTPLFVGSEGTLGLIVEIVLKLLPLPEKRKLYLVFSPVESKTLELITETLLKGLTPASAEFVDRTTLKVIKEKVEEKVRTDQILKTTESLLWVEFDGRIEEVKRDSGAFEIILEQKGLSFLSADKEEDIEALWEIRRGISPSLFKLGPKKIADDVVVPRRKMVEFLRYLRKLEEESGISIASFGHAGDGNFHVNLLFKEGEEERAKSIRENLLKKVLEFFGSISGEHGIGFSKRPYVVWELDPLQIELMKKLKALFDPKGLLNPHVKLP
ncbi:FAD-binding protein [Caldimicrobium thiodismutans]|uniref:FAD-binding protein n=1 Tax=Caldimicrobium thiodismutans TaxID=1653476 RepID=A0A0U4VZP6_9BACT|nr:FAD-linked oxidase C-terminal domain-containing protein [Caldimicrobium thiodismutans]BAU22410.1 FAD-binding protein [Caldimicrobium thiodismutans]